MSRIAQANVIQFPSTLFLPSRPVNCGMEAIGVNRVFSRQEAAMRNTELPVCRSLESTQPNGRFSAIQLSTYVRENKESVTELAHCYWLLRGCPEGSPEVDWYRAEEAIDQELVGQLDLGLPA